MTKTQEQSLIANSSTKEPPEGHDFRLLNEIAKELLCVNSEDGVPDLYFDQQFNIRFYGLKYDGAQKACPWQTKISDTLPPFLCRTTEPNTHCRYLPEHHDAKFAFKSGRCQILEKVKGHPDGKLHFHDLWSEGGRQHAVLSHLKGGQKGYETPFVSAHDSLNRSIGRGLKCKATELTIISAKKLVELGYPIIQSATAMTDYSLGTDKSWLYSTEWLMLWHVPQEAVVKSYSWSQVQTKEGTLAGSKFRKEVVLKVREFELQHGLSSSFDSNDESPSSDEEPHSAQEKEKRGRKTKKSTSTVESTSDIQPSVQPDQDQGEEGNMYDDVSSGKLAQRTGEKRKRIPQQEVNGYEPHESVRFMDMASFAKSAKKHGYAKTFLQATVPCRAVYWLAKLPGFPSYTFLRRRDHGSPEERRGLNIKDLMSLRITTKSLEDKQLDDIEEENDEDQHSPIQTGQLVATAAPQNFDQSEGLALLASRLKIELTWLRNLTQNAPEAHGFVRDLIAEVVEQSEGESDSDS